jgi:hypothetical protein
MTTLEQRCREHARIALEAADLCTCPLQVHMVARDIEPTVAGVYEALGPIPTDQQIAFAATVITSANEWTVKRMAHRLHKPGASAAIEPDNPRNHYDVNFGC